MSNSFFETQSAHTNIMYWWHGVIVDDAFWAGCANPDISNENSEIHIRKELEENPNKGWGKRYKVAIAGRHYDVKANPNEADLLEMAEVCYPVTAGSGLGGTKQTSALRQGTHVVGFYADGKEGRHPVILGCFGVNEQNEPSIYPGDPPYFFRTLRSGTKGICTERLKPVGEKECNPNGGPIEANDSPLQASVAFNTKRDDGNIAEDINTTAGCENPSGIIGNIKSLLNKLTYIINLSKRGLTDLTSNIQSIVRSITRQITGLANGLMDRMRGYVTNRINNGIKDLMNSLPPFLRSDFNTKSQGLLSALSCAFNKIKNGIIGIVTDLIKQFINNYVNAPLCAATSFLGALLGNILGEVNGIIGTVVNGINSILNAGFNLSGKALDVLDFALDILKLFDCDTDNPRCPETTKWSFWRGPNDLTVSVRGGASKLVKSILDEVETALPGSESGAAANPCNSRQVPCGPPTVQILGGGGSGASANPVISVTGKILGLDFSSFGSGYTSSPQIRVVDSCGTGGGAVIQPVMQPTGQKNEFQEDLMEIVGAVVVDSGTQYIPAPNGTTGGNGLIFSKPNDTILFRTGTTDIINGKEVFGSGYDVYTAGTTFSVVAGDEVYLPQGTVAYVYDTTLSGGILPQGPNVSSTTEEQTALATQSATITSGQVVQVLNGLGPLTKIKITASGTMTAPSNPDITLTTPQVEYPISSAFTNLPTVIGSSTNNQQGQTSSGQLGQITLPGKSSYLIITEIESIYIKNPGFNYTKNDTIKIRNNRGAELDFDVNEFGEVTKVSVLNGGIGFTDIPYIYIDSPTGYNFEVVPVFKFTPLSDINLNNITPPPGAKLLSVIDCVGKVV